jgi:pimeloyl-ACP methyl ester carboxylesterase
VLPQVESLPALLLWGDRDAAVDPASAEELHRRWKNSAVVMMQNVGHMPYEEVPEEFNRVVLDFLLHDRPPTPLQDETHAVAAHNYSEPGRA